MNKAGFLVLGSAMAMGSFLFVETGCGEGGEGGSGGSGGASSSSGSKMSSSSSGPSTSSGGTPVAATCDGYCKDIMANCVGENAQYADLKTCTDVCALFPKGTPMADPSKATGNTLECRAYHAGGPSKMTPATHCSHAGITGGDLDPTIMTDAAPCGPGCDAFCDVAEGKCPDAYMDKAACVAACAMFKPGANTFDISDKGVADTFSCRAYHLLVATQTPMPHCTHITAVSETCK